MASVVLGIVLGIILGVVINVVFLAIETFRDIEALDPKTYPLKASNSIKLGLLERDGNRGRGTGLLLSL